MNKELDAKLCVDFPHLYRDRNASSRKTCMCWGFPGDGWEPIIRELSEKLQYEFNNNMTLEEKESFRVLQVKEKFGTLRYYVSAYTEAINKIIQVAEEKSVITCEDCGAPALTRKEGWWATLCDVCNENRLEKRCDVCNENRLEKRKELFNATEDKE